MMNYDDKLLDSITRSDIDEWCDLNPTAQYDGSNREEGERELFYNRMAVALRDRVRNVDHLTEVVMYLMYRVKELETRSTLNNVQ